ncbi:hypothetical protein [Ascidiimonas aurantiaca]|uniref:hypothetical protein n=1 Tax=Ascidiimonas aurantiaca TaxID=1685432 RepID=UPI0030EDC316
MKKKAFKLSLNKRSVSGLQKKSVTGGNLLLTWEEMGTIYPPSMDADCGWVSMGPVVCFTGGQTKCHG